MKGNKFYAYIKLLRGLAPLVCLRTVVLIGLKPWLIYPSLKATLDAIWISKRNFDNHHLGIGNAFKHALWNMLIIHYCKKWIGTESAIAWAKNITTAHENCVENPEMHRLMDLHNNQAGRTYYTTIVKRPLRKAEMLEFLFEKVETAVEVDHPHYFQNYPFDLVVLPPKD